MLSVFTCLMYFPLGQQPIMLTSIMGCVLEVDNTIWKVPFVDVHGNIKRIPKVPQVRCRVSRYRVRIRIKGRIRAETSAVCRTVCACFLVLW